MELQIDYNQILRLIHQLSEKEINKLAVTLNSEINVKRKSQPIQELILNAPTWNDSDFNDYTEGRNHFNNSRLA